MAIISEFLRFVLPRSSENASAFEQLRKLVSKRGLTQDQYFGYGSPVNGWDKPTDDLMCWFIGLAPNAPRLSANFERSMDKTFTDCFLAPGGGMIDGTWDYAINTNDPAGEEVVVGKEAGSILEVGQRRVALYILGWQSIEVMSLRKTHKNKPLD
ncbi:hypothetical protein IG631_09635 [Alternaria alternata]|nr:hypothetical protein IG631_09635 [Alternaria alternata]